MEESNNLKGIAWDIFTPDGGKTLQIQRLDFIHGSEGEAVGPNDIFANDLAALEFVQQMALHGDAECVNALFLVRQSEDAYFEEEYEIAERDDGTEDYPGQYFGHR